MVTPYHSVLKTPDLCPILCAKSWKPIQMLTVQLLEQETKIQCLGISSNVIMKGFLISQGSLRRSSTVNDSRCKKKCHLRVRSQGYALP